MSGSGGGSLFVEAQREDRVDNKAKMAPHPGETYDF